MDSMEIEDKNSCLAEDEGSVAFKSRKTVALDVVTFSGAGHSDAFKTSVHAPNATNASAVATRKKRPQLYDEDGNPISKNQYRKRRRWEKMMERKERRKVQEREARRAKAAAEGRDLEEEKRQQQERERKGDGFRRREEFFKEKRKEADKLYQVCIDCSFEESMRPKEINSLASQIRYCYSSNKNAKHPIRLSVASLSGQTLEIMDRVSGFPETWIPRGFTSSAEPFEVMHAGHRDRLVYLTSDADDTLEKLDHSKIYIIGGIVDRNRLKNAAIDRANALNIPTVKLPISNHLQLVATQVLTCNHVFDILRNVHENGNDWKRALLDALPHRKEAKELKEEAVKSRDLYTTGMQTVAELNSSQSKKDDSHRETQQKAEKDESKSVVDN